MFLKYTPRLSLWRSQTGILQQLSGPRSLSLHKIYLYTGWETYPTITSQVSSWTSKSEMFLYLIFLSLKVQIMQYEQSLNFKHWNYLKTKNG